MHNLSENTHVTLGLLFLLGMCTLTAAVPVAGYVLLGLVVAFIVGGVTWFAVQWWQTRWQAPEVDTRHPVQVPVSSSRTARREVA